MPSFLRILTLSLALSASISAQQPPPKESLPAPSDVAAMPATAKKTPGGVGYKTLTPGKGTTHPAATDMVTVQYAGWTTDGKMFDRSTEPVTFPLNRLIKGWGEALPLMVAGEKTRLWIPSTLAYNGQPNRPAGMLVFDIELIEFSPSPTAAPPDVKAPPADAKRTNSGLAYKSVKPGTGKDHPVRTSMVTVHYTGWTTDGKMFDSSYNNNKPISFPLSGVIEGWTEGVQLMVVGEKMRFWIPEKLAYKGESAPYGVLVFDIELISFK
jgi:peptidylprolyl isomerase